MLCAHLTAPRDRERLWLVEVDPVASPAVFPWYLVPLATLLPARPLFSVQAWCILAPLTYEVIDAYQRDAV